MKLIYIVCYVGFNALDFLDVVLLLDEETEEVSSLPLLFSVLVPGVEQLQCFHISLFFWPLIILSCCGV